MMVEMMMVKRWLLLRMLLVRIEGGRVHALVATHASLHRYGLRYAMID
jgi:hypothetical protein